MAIACSTCGAGFPGYLMDGNRFYCSDECFNLGDYGGCVMCSCPWCEKGMSGMCTCAIEGGYEGSTSDPGSEED